MIDVIGVSHDRERIMMDSMSSAVIVAVHAHDRYVYIQSSG